MLAAGRLVAGIDGAGVVVIALVCFVLTAVIGIARFKSADIGIVAVLGFKGAGAVLAARGVADVILTYLHPAEEASSVAAGARVSHCSIIDANGLGHAVAV